VWPPIACRPTSRRKKTQVLGSCYETVQPTPSSRHLTPGSTAWTPPRSFGREPRSLNNLQLTGLSRLSTTPSGSTPRSTAKRAQVVNNQGLCVAAWNTARLPLASGCTLTRGWKRAQELNNRYTTVLRRLLRFTRRTQILDNVQVVVCGSLYESTFV